MRKRVIPILLTTLMLLISSMLHTQPVSACVCYPPSPQEALQESDAVLVGKVISETKTRRTNNDGSSYMERDYLVEVVSIYKGVQTQQIHIVFATNFEDASGQGYITSCDRAELYRGETYFIYAFTNDAGKLEVANYTCERTRPLSLADEDKQVLGPGRAPGEVASMPGASELGNISIVTVGAILLLLFLGLWV